MVEKKGEKSMWIDEQTKEDLQLNHLLSRFQPFTSIGKQQASQLTPFLPGEEDQWQQLLNEQVTLKRQLKDLKLRIRISTALQQIRDPSPLLLKLEQADCLSITEWFHLKKFLWSISEWDNGLERANLHKFTLSQEEKHVLSQLIWKLNPESILRESFALSDSFHPELKKIRRMLHSLAKKDMLLQEKEIQEIEQTYPIKRNRFGEWVISRHSVLEVQMRQDERLFCTKETGFDVIFSLRLSPERSRIQQELQQWCRREEELELQVLRKLSDEFHPYVSLLKRFLDLVVDFDLKWARVRVGESWNGVKPEWSTACLSVVEAKHPLMVEYLNASGSEFTPFSIEVHSGVTVIMGPNMGGKTVALKTLGLIVCLAQLGFFVPAQKCQMPLFSWIGSLIGDYQEMNKGLSSFGAEIARLIQYLKKEKIGLLLLDEIGRGTNPLEGVALSEAITIYLQSTSHFSIHVTHFHQVAKLQGVRGYQMAGLKDLNTWPMKRSIKEVHRSLQERMDFRLLPLETGGAISEQALIIAEGLGLPQEIVAEARKRLQKEE
jgi:DNA mismatch repair protein MutS2